MTMRLIKISLSLLVITGGIGESEGGIDNYMAEQSKTATNEADIIIFVVEACRIVSFR